MADALEGVLVIDMTQNAAGPLAAAPFADFGATVIHVEPMGGANERAFLPDIEGRASGWLWFSRGKKSITLNLHHPKAVEIVRRLVERADVFIESTKPGTMERNGLGYEDLHAINPRLVYLSVTGFGSRGPLANKPSYDLMGQAMSGRLSVTGPKGSDGYKDGNSIADFSTGLCGFAAAMVALFHAKQTGEGQHVETSLIQSMLYLNTTFDRLQDGTLIRPNGNHHSGNTPFGVFSNGRGDSVVICAPQPKAWAAVCNAMGKPELVEDERYNTLNKRVAVQDEIIDIIEEWLASFENFSDAIAALDAAGAPNCQVLNNAQVREHPQILANDLLVEAETPTSYEAESYVARNTFAHLFGTPGRIRKTDDLGESNYEILGELGYSRKEVDALLGEMRVLE